jgi:hypothetical protein
VQLLPDFLFKLLLSCLLLGLPPLVFFDDPDPLLLLLDFLHQICLSLFLSILPLTAQLLYLVLLLYGFLTHLLKLLLFHLLDLLHLGFATGDLVEQFSSLFFDL